MKPTLTSLLSLFLTVNSQFSTLGKQYILEDQNSFRNEIAHGVGWANNTESPPAANMVELKWSPELEESAQKYADSCRIPSKKENNLNFYNTTQDFTTPPATDIAGLFASVHWAFETLNKDWPSNIFSQEFIDSGMDSFTKIIWANATAIGCALSRCNIGSETILHVICQYNGNVNVIGKEIYKSGDICSACPPGTYCEKDKALCTF